MPSPVLTLLKEITLNLDSPNDLVYVAAKQYDALARKVKINLIHNNSPWTIPENLGGVIRYIKPDRTMGMYDTDEDGNSAIDIVSGSNGYITITLARQVLTAKGTVKIEISLYSSAAEKLTTFAFPLVVEESALSDIPYYQSEDYYNFRSDMAEIRRLNESFAEAIQGITGTYPIDVTLTQSGGIAEAKAAGDLVLNLANAYNVNTVYKVDDYCTYNLRLYRCKVNMTSAAGTWNSNNWTRVNLNALYSNVVQNSAVAYSTSKVYKINDFCTYNGKLYKCKTSMTEAEEWDSNRWTRVTFGGTFSNYGLKTHATMITTLSDLNNLTTATPRCDNFPDNTVVVIGADDLLSESTDNAVSIGNTTIGTYITLHADPSDSSHNTARKQIFINRYGLATRAQTGNSGTWQSWVKYVTESGLNDCLLDSIAMSAHGYATHGAAESESDVYALTYITGVSPADIDDLPINSFVYVTSNASTVSDPILNLADINGRYGGVYATFHSRYSDPSAKAGRTQVCFGYSGGIATRTFIGTNETGGWSDWICLKTEPKIYYVGPSREYKSLTQLFIDLKNDTKNEKIIYIDGGNYNIYQEYRKANVISPDTAPSDYDPSLDYLDYCIVVPPKTKIIGIGDVILNWDPPVDLSEITAPVYNSELEYKLWDYCTYNDTIYVCKELIIGPEDWDENHWMVALPISLVESQTWSPINVKYDIEMENITVLCNNGRYCIHDDPRNNPIGTTHVYKNVRTIRNTRSPYVSPTPSSDDPDYYGYAMCVGMGYVTNGKYLFDGCYFENHITGTSNAYCIGGHEGTGNMNYYSYEGPEIIFKDCIMLSDEVYSMRISTINRKPNGYQRIRMNILGCYLNQKIRLRKAYSDSHQFYDLTILHTEFKPYDDNNLIGIDIGPDNPFPPKIFPPPEE